MSIQLFDNKNIHLYQWSEEEYFSGVKAYFNFLLKSPSTSFARNVFCKINLLNLNNNTLPISLCTYVNNNSYVCSIHTQYIKYPLADTKYIKNPIKRIYYRLALKSLGLFVKWFNLDNAVHVNNWLLPMSIYPKLTETDIEQIIDYLSKRFPRKAIIFRTLNKQFNQPIIDAIDKLGGEFIYSRRVYLLKKETYEKFHQQKLQEIEDDIALRKEYAENVIHINRLSRSTCQQIKALYELRNAKDSLALNPLFTEGFFAHCVENPLYNMRALKQQKEITAVLGCVQYNGITYAPILGFDDEKPKNKDLYRILSSLKVDAASTRGHHLHAGGRAAEFKLSRGHTEAKEYHGLFLKHIPLHKKLLWKVLIKITNKVRPAYY